MEKFRKLKSFGQHFLKDAGTAEKIVAALGPLDTIDTVLEIGPGLGILTKYLQRLKGKTLFISEIDERVISFIKKELSVPDDKIITGDFLKADLSAHFKNDFVVIGNFPFNISSQILFRVLDHKNQVPLVVGMFQKEMAKRVVAHHGNKDYGVISVLVQASYDTEYLFELAPDEFEPPPKVHAAVIRLKRKKEDMACSEKLFKQLVKAGFNQRRKKLSNALSGFPSAKSKLVGLGFADMRAEELSINDFILLTQSMEQQEYSGEI